MIINKEGKLVANVSQPTVIFDTKAEYETWLATLPKPECEADFIVIKGYELAPGGVFEVEKETDLAKLDDAMKIEETLYVVTENNKGFRYDTATKKFIPLFIGGEVGTKLFYAVDLTALRAFEDAKKNKEYVYYAFTENAFYRYNDAADVKDFQLISAESDVIFYNDTPAAFVADVVAEKAKVNKYYLVKDGNVHRMFFVVNKTTAVLLNTPYGDAVTVSATVPIAVANQVVYVANTTTTGFYVNGKAAAYLTGGDHVYVTTKPAAAADMVSGVCYIVDDGTNPEKLYILDASKTGIIEINASQVVDVPKTGALPTYDKATYGTLYIEQATGLLKAKNPNYDPAEAAKPNPDPAKKDPYWVLGTDIQALVKRIEKLEAISNDVRVLTNLAAIKTLINNGTISDDDVVDMLFIAKDTKRSYIAVANPDYDPDTEGSEKFLASGVAANLSDDMPKLTTAAWKALAVKPDYAIITDAAYDADIDFVIS